MSLNLLPTLALVTFGKSMTLEQRPLYHVRVNAFSLFKPIFCSSGLMRLVWGFMITYTSSNMLSGDGDVCPLV